MTKIAEIYFLCHFESCIPLFGVLEFDLFQKYTRIEIRRVLKSGKYALFRFYDMGYSCSETKNKVN